MPSNLMRKSPAQTIETIGGEIGVALSSRAAQTARDLPTQLAARKKQHALIVMYACM